MVVLVYICWKSTQNIISISAVVDYWKKYPGECCPYNYNKSGLKFGNEFNHSCTQFWNWTPSHTQRVTQILPLPYMYTVVLPVLQICFGPVWWAHWSYWPVWMVHSSSLYSSWYWQGYLQQGPKENKNKQLVVTYVP